MDKRLQSNNDSLIKIVDHLGKQVKGSYRTKSGSVVFKDDAKLSAYLTRKTAALDKINEIDELKRKIDLLLELTKDNK